MAPITRSTLKQAHAGHTTLSVPRRFRPGSTLHKYLAKRAPTWVSRKTLASSLHEALHAMTQILHDDNMLDKGNPQVVIGNSEFTKVMGYALLSKAQVVQLIYQQFEPIHPYVYGNLTPLVRPLRLRKWEIFDDKGTYSVQPAMRELLNTMNYPPSESVHELPYPNFCRYVEQYIHAQRKRLVCPKNPEILDLRGGILEKIFQVKVLHRRQVTQFLRNHLQQTGNSIKQFAYSFD